MSGCNNSISNCVLQEGTEGGFLRLLGESLSTQTHKMRLLTVVHSPSVSQAIAYAKKDIHALLWSGLRAESNAGRYPVDDGRRTTERDISEGSRRPYLLGPSH
jgi:hypothetical protein